LLTIVEPLQQVNVHELTQSLFDKRSWLAAVDPAMGKYLTASIAYRGKLGTRDSESYDTISSFAQSLTFFFVQSNKRLPTTRTSTLPLSYHG
jgi:hypothetical protein